MLIVFQVLAVVLVAIGMALSLAHALELPGKLRLSKEAYVAAQSIYYPGFTIGGLFGEFGAMLMTLVLLVVTPAPSAAFWLTLAALAALVIMHAVYWVLTHPVNKFWLEGQQLKGAGAAFFGIGGKAGSTDRDWIAMRDQWEYSHVARAVLAMCSLILLVMAVAL